MPKPDGTMTFEEWLTEEAKHTQFDEGDTPEVFRKLGKEFLKEELRKEEESRLRRLRKRREKRNQNLKHEKGMKGKMKISLLTQIAPENRLLNRLGDEANKALNAFIAVSFIQRRGLAYLFEKLKGILDRGGNIAIFTSGYLRITDPKALKYLLSLSKSYPLFKVYFNPEDRFHSKFLLFEMPKAEYSLFVGSSNITIAGLAEVGELNVHIKGAINDSIHKDANIVLNNLLKNHSFQPIDEDLIDKYEENWKKMGRKQKARKVQTYKKQGGNKHLQSLQHHPIYTAEKYYTDSEMIRIEREHPAWKDYVSYSYIKDLKLGDYFLRISIIKGKRKTFTFSKLIEFDRVKGIGNIAHIQSGREIFLEKLAPILNVLGIKLNEVLNGKKTRLDLGEWTVIERKFKSAFRRI